MTLDDLRSLSFELARVATEQTCVTRADLFYSVRIDRLGPMICDHAQRVEKQKELVAELAALKTEAALMQAQVKELVQLVRDSMSRADDIAARCALLCDPLCLAVLADHVTPDGNAISCDRAKGHAGPHKAEEYFPFDESFHTFEWAD